MYKLLTVDVWDTLLRRKSHPDASKYASAHGLAIAYSKELRLEYQDTHQIVRERCRIEGEFATDRLPVGSGEYEIGEVLERLVERVTHCVGDDISKIVSHLIQIEIDFEIRNTFVDPDVLSEIGKYPAEKRYFLSDFYMGSAMLRTILHAHGLAGHFDGGICSCDTGSNKRTGGLYKHVHEKFRIRPGEHFHIGDNIDADVAMAVQAGSVAVHFEPRAEHLERIQRALQFTDRQSLFRGVAARLVQETVAKETVADIQQESAFLLGVKAAPLFAGFLMMIAEKSLGDGVEQLHFFTREGEFFLQIWKALFPDRQLKGLTLPTPAILEVSRIATFAASLREVSTAELMRMWNLYSTQSMQALCKSMGLSPELIRPLSACYSLDMDEEVIYPWLDPRVQALFKDETFIEFVRNRIESDRAHLLNYMAGKGLVGNSDRVGVVDIGWRGTIQDNLAWLLPSQNFCGYYLGLQRFLNEQPPNCSKLAFGPNLNDDEDGQSLLDAVSVLEMLCNSPYGSVMGYVNDDEGNLVARRLIDEGENSVFRNFTNEFQRGVVAAISEWSPVLDAYVVQSKELRSTALRIWTELIATPPGEVVNAFARLNHNEIFGVGGFKDHSRPPSLGDLISSPFSRRHRTELILYLRQTQWPSGIWNRRDLAFLHRLALVGVLHLALGYKRIRNWMRRRRIGN